MTKYIVTYLYPDFDGRGHDRLRTGMDSLSDDSDDLEDVGRRISRAGMMARNADGPFFVTPSAIMRVERSHKQG